MSRNGPRLLHGAPIAAEIRGQVKDDVAAFKRRYGFAPTLAIVMVGRSNVVGKPAAILLLRENTTVTVCHSRTRDLAAETRRAEVLVVAVGKPGLITGSMLKRRAVVIDVGINVVGDRIVGDVDFE